MITLAKTSDLNASDSSGKPFILTSLNIQLYYGGVHLSNSPDGVYWRPNSCKAYAKFTDFPTVRSVIWSNIMYLWIANIKKNQRGNISSLLPEYVLACENSLVLSSMVLKGLWSKKKNHPEDIIRVILPWAWTLNKNSVLQTWDVEFERHFFKQGVLTKP